jgi:Holliday junction resolvase RusA-like endonuclease
VRVAFEILGAPVGKGRPRVDHRSGRVHEDAKTAAHERAVAKTVRAVFGQGDPWTGPVRVTITAVSAVPASWPKRYAAALANGAIVYDDGKPDGDNIEKLIWDACNGIVWRDDSQVAEWAGRKRYGSPERVEVLVELIHDAMGAPPLPTPAQLAREKVGWAEVLRRRAETKAARKEANKARRAAGTTSGASLFGRGRK